MVFLLKGKVKVMSGTKVARGRGGRLIVRRGSFIGEPFNHFGLTARVANDPNGLLIVELTEYEKGSFGRSRIRGETRVEGQSLLLELGTLADRGATISCTGSKQGFELWYQAANGTFFWAPR